MGKIGPIPSWQLSAVASSAKTRKVALHAPVVDFVSVWVATATATGGSVWMPVEVVEARQKTSFSFPSWVAAFRTLEGTVWAPASTTVIAARPGGAQQPTPFPARFGKIGSTTEGNFTDFGDFAAAACSPQYAGGLNSADGGASPNKIAFEYRRDSRCGYFAAATTRAEVVGGAVGVARDAPDQGSATVVCQGSCVSSSASAASSACSWR